MLNKPSLRGSPCPASPIISVPLRGLWLRQVRGAQKRSGSGPGSRGSGRDGRGPSRSLRSSDDPLVSGQLLQGLGCASPAALPSPKTHALSHFLPAPLPTASPHPCWRYAPSLPPPVSAVQQIFTWPLPRAGTVGPAAAAAVLQAAGHPPLEIGAPALSLSPACHPH